MKPAWRASTNSAWTLHLWAGDSVRRELFRGGNLAAVRQPDRHCQSLLEFVEHRHTDTRANLEDAALAQGPPVLSSVEIAIESKAESRCSIQGGFPCSNVKKRTQTGSEKQTVRCAKHL